jgi:hypothetical protein
MVNTRLEIQGLDYAIVTDIPISTTYAQADVREPDKRNATFTKTITLYGNNKINTFFENIFEANVVTQTFNPNKKVTAKYFVDEVQVLRGDLQLLKIKITNNNLINYECSIIGSEGSLFIDIGEALLEDLDFSTYNHVYSRDKQIASWTKTCDVSGTPTVVSEGTGYYYGFIDRGTNGGSDTVFNVDDFLPSFYAREYIYKILLAKGYTFTSSFLNSTEFKKYVVYPNIENIQLSQSQLDNMQWYVGLNSDITTTAATVIAAGGTVVANILCNFKTTPFFDLGSQITSIYGVLNTRGLYNIVASNVWEVSFTHTDSSVLYMECNIQTATIISKSSDSGATYFTLNYSQSDLFIGPFFTVGVPVTFTGQVASGEQMFSSGDIFISNYQLIVFSSTIKYRDSSYNIVSTGTGTINIKLKSGANGTSFYALSTKKNVLEGQTILANKALPKKIKQKDFLKSIMQYANLFIDVPDKNKPKELVIESYDTYFNTGFVNWENKIDLNKEISVNPLSLIDGRKYIYKYKIDSDFYNKKYNDSFSESFGTKIINVDNDFIKAEKTNELIFSPTPNVGNIGLLIPMPKIFQDDPSLGVKTVIPNIRLLYAGGTKQAGNKYTFKQSGISDLITKDYGFISHVDNNTTPTIDLNFGVPKEVYYTFINASWTTNNAYNRFHRNFIFTNTSRDSKVLVAFLWLTPKDISEFSFRKKYFVKDAYYIINKIINYNPMINESTQCELIKVLDAVVFTPVTTTFNSSPVILDNTPIL